MRDLNMKKALLALAAVAAFTAPALAAAWLRKLRWQRPFRTRPPGQVSGSRAASDTAWLTSNIRYVHRSLRSPSLDTGHDNGARGWLGKVGVGYDYQMSSW